MFLLLTALITAFLYKPIRWFVNEFIHAPDEHELWPHGADEPLGDALERVHPRPGSNLDTCNRILAATELDEARRNHPSSRPDA
jgi:hypothetical protein